MSGVPLPPQVIVPFANEAADPAFITLPVPINSQTGVTPGAASFTDGFPPLTMPSIGDPVFVAPFGQDMNGILYTLSAFCALLQAGQACAFDDEAQYAWGGYAKGARLASTSVAGRIWTNNLAGNDTDPDVDATNWVADVPLQTGIVLSGTQNNYVLPGASDYVLDFNTTAAPLIFTGFVARRDGQKLYLTPAVSANLMTVNVEAGGSTAANRVRGGADLSAIQNQTVALQYVAGISRWIFV